jgi:hypothetical protein
LGREDYDGSGMNGRDVVFDENFEVEFGGI